MSAGRIDLKDGFCVSCGLESGARYHTCPFCGERVWHPLWRRCLHWYITLILPLGALFFPLLNYRFAVDAIRAYAAGSWQLQLLITISAGLLFYPYENRNLILPSSHWRIRWLLNSLFASMVLFLAAALFAGVLRFVDGHRALRLLCCVISLSGLAVPLVLNCSWWRLLPAAFFALGFLVV